VFYGAEGKGTGNLLQYSEEDMEWEFETSSSNPWRTGNDNFQLYSGPVRDAE
jgi:hypothetical protein